MLFVDCHLSLVPRGTFGVVYWYYCIMFHVEQSSFLLYSLTVINTSPFSTLYRFTDSPIHRFTGAQRLNYLPIITSKMFTSLGDTPGIRLACAMVSGSVLMSF